LYVFSNLREQVCPNWAYIVLSFIGVEWSVSSLVRTLIDIFWVPDAFSSCSEEPEVLEDPSDDESEASDQTEDEDEDEGQGMLPETSVPGSNVAGGPDVVGDEDFDMDKEAEEVRFCYLRNSDRSLMQSISFSPLTHYIYIRSTAEQFDSLK
jgi:hypothetical protein